MRLFFLDTGCYLPVNHRYSVVGQRQGQSRGKKLCLGSHWNHVTAADSKETDSFNFFRAFSKCYYPKRLATVNTHIDTPTAESTIQGDSQLVLSVLLRDTSTLS